MPPLSSVTGSWMGDGGSRCGENAAGDPSPDQKTPVNRLVLQVADSCSP